MLRHSKVAFCWLVIIGNLFALAVAAQAQKTFTDGPYIFTSGDTTVQYESKIVISSSQKDLPGVRANTLIQVEDDTNGQFIVKLKEEYNPEPSEYKKSRKMVVISDIEGNFTAFKKLLIATGVIDKTYQWNFGKGHLVLTGDYFDRGNKVVETLWLIYKMEQQAENNGGKVHFILGNHETMNLQGDLRYVHPKYQFTAQALGKPLSELYSEDTELGKWLRTKNIIEKIGDHLFVHAGISEEVNNLNLSVPQINEAARPVLDQYKRHESDTLQTLMWDKGPLWYRGYYGKEPVSHEVIETTLKSHNVTKIITGHTVVADSISSWYNGKVINIDTPHSHGKSEALLIRKGKYYRITADGDRFPLFDKK